MLNQAAMFIGIDGDDTIWMNEDHFKQLEHGITEIFESDYPEHAYSERLLSIEKKNIPNYGYGKTSFVKSIEESLTEFDLTEDRQVQIEILIKEFLQTKACVLPGVFEALAKLKELGELLLITKGARDEQEAKIEESGVAGYFSDIIIVDEKDAETYQRILDSKSIANKERFLMLGNSLRSDILPALSIGCSAIHIPYHIDWEFEKDVHESINDHAFHRVENLDSAYKIILEEYSEHRK